MDVEGLSSADYLIFTNGKGKLIFDDLDSKFKARFYKNEPMETHVSRAQAEVVEYLRKRIKEAGYPHE